MSYQLTSAILGVFLASAILWLIRRDYLHTRHASWWLVVAFLVVLLGLFPQMVDFVAAQLGISYPPTLVFILGMGMILIKVINIDLHQSYLETRMRRLAQRLAILEGEKYRDQ
jgi:hypothetical protein